MAFFHLSPVKRWALPSPGAGGSDSPALLLEGAAATQRQAHRLCVSQRVRVPVCPAPGVACRSSRPVLPQRPAIRPGPSWGRGGSRTGGRLSGWSSAAATTPRYLGRYAQLCSCCWSWGRDVLDEAVCRVGRPPAQFLAPTRGPSCRAVYNRHRRPSSHCLARKQEPQHGTAEQGREEQGMAGQTTAGHST